MSIKYEDHNDMLVISEALSGLGSICGIVAGLLRQSQCYRLPAKARLRNDLLCFEWDTFTGIVVLQ